MRNILVATIFMTIFATSTSLKVFAEELVVSTSEGEKFEKIEDVIEVHLKEDLDASYKERRSNWTYRIAPSWEKVLPYKFYSLADGRSYAEIFGTNEIQMISINFGAQYNTAIGGLYIDAIYGSGSVSSGAATLSMQKTGIGFGLFLNSLFSSPWVSPFIGGQAFYLNWKELDTNIDLNGKTALTTELVAGIAIHLDKIDSQAAIEAYNEHGLRNTYLDVFGTLYNTSSSSNDPDFKTAFNVGAAFRLEF